MSDEWERRICLRVVGGQLLSLLLSSLRSLERGNVLNSHVLHACLNNRRWKVPDMNQPQASENISAPNNTSSAKRNDIARLLEKAYGADKHWNYEKIVVKLVFYDKLDMSNIPYVIDHSHTYTESPPTIPQLRNVSIPPFSTRIVKMNNVRLPAGENEDTKQKISHLKDKIATLQNKGPENIASATAIPGRKGLKKSLQESVKAETIKTQLLELESVDIIAEEPFLRKTADSEIEESMNVDSVNMNIPKPNKRSTVTKSKTLESKEMETDQTQIMGQVEETIEDEAKQSLPSHQPLSRDRPSAIGIAERRSTVQASERDAEDSGKIGIGYQGTLVEEQLTKAMGVNSYLQKGDSGDKLEKPVFQRLNLSGNEFYVTGLYAPRLKNRKSSREKLRTLLRQKALCAPDKRAPMKRPQDPHCLPPRRRNIRSHKNSAANILTEDTAKRFFSEKEVEWDQYAKNQEVIEMGVALQNDLEKGVLQRLLKEIDGVAAPRPTTKEMPKTEKAIKGKRNNKNNSRGSNKIFSSDRNINNRMPGNEDSTMSHMFRKPLCSKIGDNITSYRLTPCNSQLRKTRCDKTQPLLPCRRHNGKVFPLQNEKWGSSHTYFREESIQCINDLPNLLTAVSLWRCCLDNGEYVMEPEGKEFKLPGMLCSGDDKTLRPLAASTSANQPSKVRVVDVPVTRGKNCIANDDVLQPTRERRATKQQANGSLHLNTNQNSEISRDPEISGASEDELTRNATVSLSPSDIQFENMSKRMNIVSNHKQSHHEPRSPNAAKLGKTTSRHMGKATNESEHAEVTTLQESKRPSFSCECTCWECVDIDDRLGDLKCKDSCMSMSQYPLILGQLSRDHRFLQYKDYVPKSRTSAVDPSPDISQKCSLCVCQEILNIINDVVIRKEILSSSLGHTYTTITFTKKGVFDEMKIF